MDDKIIDKLDNIDEAAADQLLDSIGEYEAVDTGAADRIKTSVLGKAGIEREFKSPLIPNKPGLLAGCFAITLVELLFFTVFAFIAWMDGFLSCSGIDLGFGGVVPAALYVIMFVFMSLSLYLAMYHMDSSFSLKRAIPKNRTFLGYFLYFILSSAVKVVMFILFIYIGENVTDYNGFSFIDQIPVLVLFIVALSVADMFLSKFKNMIIMRFEGVSSSPFNWRINIRSFLMELLKYTVVTGAGISFAFLGVKAMESEISIAIQFIANIFALWIINMFFSIVILLKKRHYMKTTPWMIKGSSVREADGKTQQAETGTRWVYFRQRAVAVGVLGAAFLYVVCLAIPYVGKISLRNEKPSLIAFSCKEDAVNFFSNSKLPFEVNTNLIGANDLSESLYVFNKMLSCAAFLNPDISLGMGNVKSDESADNSFNGGIVMGNSTLVTTSEASKTKYEFSKTNTQVENVDEADVIKTDGKYMYYLSQGKLSIVKANPPENMEIIHRIDFNKEGLSPEELFLYKEYLTVILTGNNSIKTVVRTYNVKDPYNPKRERDFELNYSYLTARMVENNMYLVSTTSTTDYYNGYNQPTPTPLYWDSAIGSQPLEIDYKNLYFMRGNSDSNYSSMNIVAAFPVNNPCSKAQIKGYIGGYGENVYVSTKHIYIVESSGNVSINAPIKDFIDNFTCTDSENMDFQKYGTDIYRIDIQDGTIGGFDSAFVSGTVHNQFSMDEYNGYFRLATQTGNYDDASSNVYVLDENMKLCGSLEGLAPKESIYSSRFMGDRLYLVTFKKVDPLFVINLKDPRKPTVMGKLKIPGYSEYIHPLDENHIIGFGKDTAGGDESFAWYQGIKMAIFDVTDVKNPKEKFVEIIGDRGTDSELLRNHKALMFMEEPGIMAFPVSVAKVPEGSVDNEYGSVTFQGAYVYNVSSTEGFKLRGKITHMDQKSDYNVPQMLDDSNGDYVNRIIYANESLYTFSDGKVKATRYSDMKEASEISLK